MAEIVITKDNFEEEVLNSDFDDVLVLPDFDTYISEQENILEKRLKSESRFSAVYIRHPDSR